MHELIDMYSYIFQNAPDVCLPVAKVFPSGGVAVSTAEASIENIVKLLSKIYFEGDGRDCDVYYDELLSKVNSVRPYCDFSSQVWVDIIFLCYSGGLVDIALRLSDLVVSQGFHRVSLLRAAELARGGDLIRAAYVVRDCHAYSSCYSAVSAASVPPIVLEEIVALPATARLLDLGCGTGLIGAACRQAGYAGHLAGVDLVDDMVAGLPAGIYDTAAVADVFAWLPACGQTWDVVLSFGVFVHFGVEAAGTLIDLVARRLNVNGLFAFNAAEHQFAFIHALPVADAIPLINRAGLEFEAMVRREERTTYICRKL